MLQPAALDLPVVRNDNIGLIPFSFSFLLLPFYFLLFEGGFEVIDDFLGEDVEISNIPPDPGSPIDPNSLAYVSHFRNSENVINMPAEQPGG